MDSAKFWGDMAASYAKSKISDMDAYEYGLERVRAYLGADDRLLELGCGTGSTALLLAGSVRELVATDVAPQMVEIGAQKALDAEVSNLRFEVGTVGQAAGEAAGGAAGFDAVLALNLLHLLPDLEADLGAIHGALKPGGVFISKTFFIPSQGESLKSRMMRMLLPALQWIGKAPYVRFFRAGDLEGLIGAAGFEIVETGCYPADRRFIVARKL